MIKRTMLKRISGILLCLCLLHGYVNADDSSDEDGPPCHGLNCPPKRSEIEKVMMKPYCGKTYTLSPTTAAISLVPSAHQWTPITPCMHCAVTLETAAGSQAALTAFFYSLGLNTGPGGTCSLARLDVFDGASTEECDRLSGPGGVCGSSLPDAAYTSTNRSLTVRLTTPCGKPPAKSRFWPYNYGNFEMVVASYTADVSLCPGKYQCASGKCINTTLICNGQNDCPDGSDERDCPTIRPMFPAWAIFLLVVITLCVMILAAYVIYMLCAGCWLCCFTPSGYQKV